MTTSHSGGTLPGSRWSQPPEQTSDRPTFSQATPRAAACPINGVPLTDTAEQSFGDFPIHPDIVAALADHGITHPFPIQAMTLPVALGGHDIIGQAKTGTGKTLGFGIPLLQRVVSPRDPEWYADLTRTRASRRRWPSPRPVSSPCRSPADLERAGKRRGIRVLTIYGGRAYEPQVEALQRGVEVVVGTPGRLIDLAKQGHLDLATPASSSSTRPTRCSTWASCPMSRRCWR
jgi:superfamily II DNA/RNA helicase